MENTWHVEGWLTPEYQKEKHQNFLNLSSYLNFAPKTLLDIGCGMAWESRYFYNSFGTELWLIDGDSNENQNGAADAKYHINAKNFGFYHTIEYLKKQIDSSGFTNYNLINSNNINIPKDKKFDVITSWLSCGFHYPVSTYKNLIQAHSHENTKIVMDIRTELKTKNVILEEDIEIVHIISYHKKHINAEIRFKK